MYPAWLLLALALSVLGALRPASAQSLEFQDPALSITNYLGDFALSWPQWAEDWVVEQSERSSPLANWTRLSPSLYQTDGTSRYVRVSPQESGGFYRLRRLGPVAPGLTSSWQFEEGAGERAEAEDGRAIFLDNTLWSEGRFGGGALRFNGLPAEAGGSKAWVSNLNHLVLPVSGQPFSLSLWLSLDTTSSDRQGIAGNTAQGSNGWHLALHSPGPGTNLLVFESTGIANSLSITGRALLLPAEWRQVALTYDGAEARLYLDGTLLASASGLIPQHDGPIHFGGAAGGYASFCGRIDDIRTYTNCLTPEQISLNGHWRLDEGGGRFCVDSSVRGNHATITDSTGWVPGRNGSGLQLNSCRLIIPNNEYGLLPPSGGSFSISLWLRPDSLETSESGLMSCGTGTDGGWQLALRTAQPGQPIIHLSSTNYGGSLDMTSPIPLTNSTWTKLDVTYNGGIATLYANGRMLRSASGAIRATRVPLVVGASTGLPNFNGVIDDLKIYNRERSASEIGPIALTMWETVLLNGSTNIQLQGSGPPGRPLTYTLVSIAVPTNGTLVHSPGSQVVTYHAGARKGPDAFAYTVSDGEFTSAPVIVAMSVVQPHWLSPNEGPIQPRDGTRPEQAWMAGSTDALDAIWKTNNYYDCFFYAAGEYTTRGWKFGERGTANPGCKHIGAGVGGTDFTRVRLVDNWNTWTEGIIFALRHGGISCDGFEVQKMILDCNAASNPKYERGEPVWIQIPLMTTTRVDTVTLKWKSNTVPGTASSQFGRASEFDLCARSRLGNTYQTNCVSLISTGQTDVIGFPVVADELILQLNRRSVGVDFYSLAEVEVAGAEVSIPSASIPDAGESQLEPDYAFMFAVDQNPGTFWASGPEEHVNIVLPLSRGAAVSQLNLHWNCKTLDDIGRLGPAADYSIRVRDELTGDFYTVPFIRHSRTADGVERITFGTAQATNAITTDRIMLVLTERQIGVDYYSLREISLQNGSTHVAMRLPTALNALSWGINYDVWRAFDRNLNTAWASGTQGSITAMAVMGNNMKFKDLKIVGFGTKALRECFPMYLGMFEEAAGPAHRGNVLVEDCIFVQPATNNADGLTTLACFAAPPNTLTNAIIRRCTVSGMKPYFLYSQGFAGNQIENCLVENCSKAVYFEPDGFVDDVGPVLIRSNRFINVTSGVYLTMHPGTRFDSITCLNNEIVLDGGTGWGLAACDTCDPGPSASITNVTALNNIIRYADWAPRPLSIDGGILYSDIQHAVFGNNLVILGNKQLLRLRHCPSGLILPPPPTEDCDGQIFVPPGEATRPPCLDALLPGYRRAWFNNRNLSGELLPIRFLNNSVDGFASQQQWPE
jgi:hypothetical protein